MRILSSQINQHACTLPGFCLLFSVKLETEKAVEPKNLSPVYSGQAVNKSIFLCQPLFLFSSEI